MSDVETQQRGEIPLHDPHAIGLQLSQGNIGLHPYGASGWMVAIRLNVDLQHWRAPGESGGFMLLEFMEMGIPAPHGNYVGRIEGWDRYKSIGSNDYYKPRENQFLPGHPEFTTFAMLDEWDEEDPWFWFGWGLRTDHESGIGQKRRNIVAYMGVNYPIEDNVRPSWVEVPTDAELLGMMQPHAPSGEWTLRARISPFIIDPDTRESRIIFWIWEGLRRYHRGALDFVRQNDWVVGEDDANWSGIHWGSMAVPGELRILSGLAKGRVFPIVDSFYTGENPPAGYPPETWCLAVDPNGPQPSAVGVKAGDKYMAVGLIDRQVYSLLDYHDNPGPGSYPSRDLEWTFTPIF
jgi:hypothetical protein